MGRKDSVTDRNREIYSERDFNLEIFRLLPEIYNCAADIFVLKDMYLILKWRRNIDHSLVIYLSVLKLSRSQCDLL